MTTVSEVLRSPTGGKSDVVERLVGLEEATDAARGRLDDHLVTEAADVAAHAEARLKLSGEHTVVALAGSTGSGKSSLFNQLCGLDLAAVGVKRPTTSWALGCAWGPDGAGELLDWVGVPKRHQTNRTSILDEAEAARDLHGLVLLDLPDHDSTEVSHHLEVQRLVGLADVLVWVVDPQKYADAALHDRYLRPLAPHADVLMVVLNHVDEMPADAVDPTMADLARLLHGDGLGAALVIATSATREDGLADLREAVATRVRQKKQASERLAADISAAAGAMAQQTGSGGPRDIGTSARGALVDACADAAGGSSALAAVQSTSRSQARRASSWPAARWLAWLRPAVGEQPDPAETASQSADESRVAPAEPSRVHRARIAAAARAACEDLTAEMSRPWATAVRTASLSRLDEVTRRLDQIVSSTRQGRGTGPRWWRGVWVLQWLLLLVAIAGGVWWFGSAALSSLGLPHFSSSDVYGVPLPAVLVVGGLVAGLLVAGVGQIVAAVTSRRRAASAHARLRHEVGVVCDELVVGPMQAEADAYTRCRHGLRAALGA